MYGIQASRRGVDVNEAEKWQLTLDSTRNTLKIKEKGTGEMVLPTAVTGRVERTINHNLGYKPMFCVFARHAGQGAMLPALFSGSGWQAVSSTENIDDFSIRFSIISVLGLEPPAPITFRYEWWVFVDPKLDNWF
jgi:hypothetical protein